MPLEQITTEMDVQMPQSGKKLKVMKKKVVEEESVKQGKELDTLCLPILIIRSPKILLHP